MGAAQAHAGNRRHRAALLVVTGMHGLLLWAALQAGGLALHERHAASRTPGVLMLWQPQPQRQPAGSAQPAAPATRAAVGLPTLPRQRSSPPTVATAPTAPLQHSAPPAPAPVAVAVPGTEAAFDPADAGASASSPSPPAASAGAPPATAFTTPPSAPGAAPPATVSARADHRHCPSAPYPTVLQQRGIEGAALVRVRVDSEGRAAEVRLVAGSGWRLFDDAAVQRARGCRFFPAQRGGAAVESWVEFPVRFALAG
jgi:protein TonB